MTVRHFLRLVPGVPEAYGWRAVCGVRHWTKGATDAKQANCGRCLAWLKARKGKN